MNKKLLFTSIVFFFICLFNCKKDSNCDFNNYIGTYILRDSIVNSDGNISIVEDTITTVRSSGLNYQFTIQSFGPDPGFFFLVTGCPGNFSIDTASYGAGIFSGGGSFIGNLITMKIHESPLPFLSGQDTVDYYSMGSKQ